MFLFHLGIMLIYIFQIKAIGESKVAAGRAGGLFLEEGPSVWAREPIG